jgi:hypothetical protein
VDISEITEGMRVRMGSRTGTVADTTLDSNGEIAVLADGPDGTHYHVSIKPEALSTVAPPILLKLSTGGVITSNPSAPGIWRWEILSPFPGEDFRRVVDYTPAS